jgi:nitroimidazol reductase NimA-like FMN-containing flavoprotein (pyridoxamine 5'-phosphate oxidase superfamily)
MADDGHQPATEWLDEEECRTLLALRGMGRVAFVADSFPMILPVNYTLVGNLLVFRTDPGTKLSNLPLSTAAFEIDGRDDHRTVWSVVVQGHAREITTALGDLYDRVRAATIDVVAPGDKAHWIGIEIERITGRRIAVEA